MSFAPANLTGLGAAWTKRGGVNLGIVGNAVHTYGYHIGRDRIYGPSGRGDSDYSVRQSRDKAGLTNAACAIDLGKLNGSLADLRAFSKWLVAESQAKKAGTQTIREIIYTADGKTVSRYEALDGKIHTGPGNGDDSHLWHTHISFWRDTVGVVSPSLFEDYFTPRLRVRLAPGASVSLAVYDTAGAFLRWSTTTWGAVSSTAYCETPRSLTTPAGVVKVARVTAGGYAGRDILVDAAKGVTVEPVP